MICELLEALAQLVEGKQLEVFERLERYIKRLKRDYSEEVGIGVRVQLKKKPVLADAWETQLSHFDDAIEDVRRLTLKSLTVEALDDLLDWLEGGVTPVHKEIRLAQVAARRRNGVCPARGFSDVKRLVQKIKRLAARATVGAV